MLQRGHTIDSSASRSHPYATNAGSMGGCLAALASAVRWVPRMEEHTPPLGATPPSLHLYGSPCQTSS